MLWKKQKNADGAVEFVVSEIGEYSLEDTLECGQCFRFERIGGEDGAEYIVVARGIVFDVMQRERGRLVFRGISEREFLEVAVPYFSLDTDFADMRRDILARTPSERLRLAADGASGIAILRQDAWEALFSFIISQNNNIPRIKKIIRAIALEYGENLAESRGLKKCPLSYHRGTPCRENCVNCGMCYSFPRPEDIVARPEGLLPSHPGFRYRYLRDAAERVASGKTDLSYIGSLEKTDDVISALEEITGVGKKVASCVALFGLWRLDAFPVDVWMRRALSEWFMGELDPDTLGPYRGVAQQYIFHYVRNLSGGESPVPTAEKQA